MLTHWGCERARPGQHSANALRRLGAEVVRRAADDADRQDQDQDPARRDARPGGFVHRIGCSGCDDDDCDRRTTAAPLCPFGSDRTWEISAVRAESPAVAVAEAAADPDAAAVVVNEIRLGDELRGSGGPTARTFRCQGRCKHDPSELGIQKVER